MKDDLHRGYHRDQPRFERLFEYAQAHADAGGYLNHDEPLFPILISIDLKQETRLDELVTRITEMREQLNEYQSEYGVDSPEELAVAQTNQTLSPSDSAQPDIDPEVIRNWKTLRRNLAFANAALSIGNAERFVDDDHWLTDEGIPI